MEKFFIGEKGYDSGTIDFAGVKIMLISGSRGAVGCAYLNLDAADKFGHAMAIVRGVKSYEDMLGAKIVSVSDAAEKAGVEIGMSGKQALEIFW